VRFMSGLMGAWLRVGTINWQGSSLLLSDPPTEQQLASEVTNITKLLPVQKAFQDFVLPSEGWSPFVKDIQTDTILLWAGATAYRKGIKYPDAVGCSYVPPEDEAFWTSTTGILIMAGGGAALLIGLFILWLCWRWKQARNRRRQQIEVELSESSQMKAALMRMTVMDLRQQLEPRGGDLKGMRSELVERLQVFLEAEHAEQLVELAKQLKRLKAVKLRMELKARKADYSVAEKMVLVERLEACLLKEHRDAEGFLGQPLSDFAMSQMMGMPGPTAVSPGVAKALNFERTAVDPIKTAGEQDTRLRTQEQKSADNEVSRITGIRSTAALERDLQVVDLDDTEL